MELSARILVRFSLISFDREIFDGLENDRIEIDFTIKYPDTATRRYS